jgi:3,4-dehydroadipyl-CoA semialdehyde dehydrogenase
MKILRSYIAGQWHQADTDFRTLLDPSTEEEIGQASSSGVDFADVVTAAREEGGPALRALTFAERGALLKGLSKVLRTHRDELLDLSRRNHGTTAGDGSFDIDGASGTLAYYAGLSKGLGDTKVLSEGDGAQLAKTEAFWAQHVLVPRPGMAVAINAFNFPVWGFAEKAGCALLAGMPMVVKPATATALVTERMIELLLEAAILPPGALQLICGGTGDLLDRLGPHDVLAFTGSAATAQTLRQRDGLLAANARFNVEADSLNAAVLGPDVAVGSATFDLFIKEVAREMTQKAGQKCTAVRRILVPKARLEEVSEALAARLSRVVTGNPADESVRMGPLATAQQLADAISGVAELRRSTTLVHGTGERIDGVGSPAGKGFFFAPTLLRGDDAKDAGAVHEREVFAPVATLLPYDERAVDAAEIVALGGGTLVTSAYSDDGAWLGELLAHVGPWTGRLYIGSEASVGSTPGSGAALPQALHGGPGRAGGGEELGGRRSLAFYMQRTALQGYKPLLEKLVAQGARA